MTKNEQDRDYGRPSGQFRRNQTLSGVRRDADEASPRHKVHHLTMKRRKVGGIFFVVMAVVILMVIILTQLTAQVKLVGTSSQTVTSFDSYRDDYKEAINSYFGVNPAQRLRFLLNENDLSIYVSNQYPEVSSLKITGVSNAVESEFTVKFREPVAGWEIDGVQYYVDTEGVVFERNFYPKPSVKIVDESSAGSEEGTVVASKRLLGFVGRVVSLSEGRGYTVTKVVLPRDTTRRLDVSLKNVRPVVRFAVDRAVGEQVSDMTRSLDYLKSHGIRPSYLDVRVSGRVVYR